MDRTENEDFIWHFSPINQEKLDNLGGDFYYLNRLIDVKNYLVFPAKEETEASI